MGHCLFQHAPRNHEPTHHSHREAPQHGALWKVVMGLVGWLVGVLACWLRLIAMPVLCLVIVQSPAWLVRWRLLAGIWNGAFQLSCVPQPMLATDNKTSHDDASASILAVKVQQQIVPACLYPPSTPKAVHRVTRFLGSTPLFGLAHVQHSSRTASDIMSWHGVRAPQAFSILKEAGSRTLPCEPCSLHGFSLTTSAVTQMFVIAAALYYSRRLLWLGVDCYGYGQ